MIDFGFYLDNLTAWDRLGLVFGLIAALSLGLPTLGTLALIVRAAWWGMGKR